jgi:hypothetical protein
MRRSALALLLFLSFSACTADEGSPASQAPESVASNERSILEEDELVTHNVTYTGILEEGGVTIYQEGSHRLMLSDGKMVLLEPAKGADVGLDLYVGKLVRVKGDVMPTVEAGGTIMEVREIAWIRRESGVNGKDAEAMRVLCGGESSVGCPVGFTCELPEEGSGVCVEDPALGRRVEGEESETDVASQEEIDVEEEETEESEETEDSDEGGEEDEVKEEEEVDEEPDKGTSAADQSEVIALMTEEDYAADRWTQEYCSSHVGFCVPVHKNWYFKSFGATTSLLWHIEMGASAVENFGDGPLIVDLKTGTLSALGVSDRDVKTVGSRAIGYRSWSDNRHFEISADASIKEPVKYVTNALKEAE